MHKIRLISLAVGLSLAVSGASAAVQTLNAGSFSISYDDALVGLFGTPTLVGDSLRWFPSGSPGFTAQTADGIDLTNASFSLLITANPGYTLSSFGLASAGTYFHFGDTGVTSGVSIEGQLRVTPLPGSTSTADLALDAPTAANGFLNFDLQNWSLAGAQLVAPAGTSSANVSFDTLLAGYVFGGAGYAFAEVKEVTLSIATTPVPEPETYALMLAGLGAICFMGIRRRTYG